MERPKWPKDHIWEYKTTNPSMAHSIDRPLLNLLTGRWSGGKIT